MEQNNGTSYTAKMIEYWLKSRNFWKKRDPRVEHNSRGLLTISAYDN